MIFYVFWHTGGIRIGDAEAAGSNPVASTLGRGARRPVDACSAPTGTECRTGNRLDKGFPVLFISAGSSEAAGFSGVTQSVTQFPVRQINPMPSWIFRSGHSHWN